MWVFTVHSRLHRHLFPMNLTHPNVFFFHPAVGFLRETATMSVHHTILGSTLYAMEMGEHSTILRNSVTSPAGTTALALYELEKGQF